MHLNFRSTTWIALLRGVNVGGHNRVPMQDLRDMLAGLGHLRVETYIQSGNAVFDCPVGAPSPVAITAAIGARCGVDTPVILRQRDALLAALAASPYRDDEAKGRYLVFLDGVPGPEAIARLDPNRSPGDRFAVIGREVHLHYGSSGGGPARSKLTLDWFQRALGLTGTARNWTTSEKLAVMADRAPG